MTIARVKTPAVVNIADLLKQIQSASQNHHQQNVVIGGQGPDVTQHNSVVLGGTSSSTSATQPPMTSQGNVNYNYEVKIINPAKKVM